MRVALHTLGCKLNQYETEAIREAFLARGHLVVPFDGAADAYVVNSCTVTLKADHDARRLLRQARRRNPRAIVVATGCYAQTDAPALAAMPEVDLVLGNQEKARLVEAAEAAHARREPARPGGAADPSEGARAETGGADGAGARGPEPYPATPARVVVADIAEAHGFPDGEVLSFAEHTRAFVKIQDGCDARCAYCKVPYARGPNRSQPFDDALSQVRALAAAGHRETVLIGIHLGTYGRDLTPPSSLAKLLSAIVAEPAPERVRLSSIEPLELTRELIDVLAGGAGRICRHLHVPLQSGSDAVLARMNRGYTAAEYAGVVQTLATRIPGAAVGADVIVGFPGESEEDFAATRALVESLPIAYLHVFSYSRRPGTPAAAMRDPVRPDMIRRRCRELRALSEALRDGFLRGLVGTTQRVLFERPREGLTEGLTDTYARVAVPEAPGLANALADVAIEGVDGERCLGRVVAAWPLGRGDQALR
jgi:threonylcarbamoyladenosine tRNA methylthiotransferase MtaB